MVRTRLAHPPLNWRRIWSLGRPNPVPEPEWVAFDGVVLVHASAEAARSVIRWSDSEFEAIDADTSRVRTRAEALDGVVSTVAVLAIHVAVEVEGPPEVIAGVEMLRNRLAGSNRTK